MRLTFGPLSTDRPILNRDSDILLSIVAEISIVVGDRCFLREEMFPVVELATHLRRWLAALDEGEAADFAYESMEAEDPLLRFVNHDGRWSMDSPIQEYEETRVFSTDELRAAASRFVADVRREVAAQLGIDVGRVVEQRGPR